MTNIENSDTYILIYKNKHIYFLNYIGKQAYDVNLFLQESLALGEFNRAIGNRIVPLSSKILFGVYKNKSTYIFAMGTVNGYSFIALQRDVDALIETAWALAQDIKSEEEKKDANRLLELAKKLNESYKNARANGGSDVERGCGSYIQYELSDFSPNEFYELCKLYMRFYGKLPFKIFITGTILAYTESNFIEIPNLTFSRGLIKIKLTQEQLSIINSWTQRDGVNGSVYLLDNYVLKRSRSFEEKKNILKTFETKSETNGT